MCLVGIWVLVPSVSALESVMKLKLFLLCHSLNAEKFEFYYTFQGTEFGNGIFISLQFSAPENPSVHPVPADSPSDPRMRMKKTGRDLEPSKRPRLRRGWGL